MPGEVAARQLGQRFIEGKPARCRRALVERGIGELLAAARAAAHDRFQLRVHEQQRQPQSVGGNAGVAQRHAQIVARGVAAALHRPRDHVIAAREHLRVQAGLPVVRRVEPVNARRAERQHPADVGRRHQVPGGAQHVCAEDRAAAERVLDIGVGAVAGSLRDRPLHAQVVLRLDRAQAGDDRFWAHRTAADQPLIAQAAVDQVREVSGGRRHGGGSGRRGAARALGGQWRDLGRAVYWIRSRLSRPRVGFSVGELDARALPRIATAADGPDATQAALWERLQRGDASAFDEVYRRHTPGLFAFLARLSGRPAIAEELLQETWLRLATHARGLARDTNLRAWLYTVARNLYRSHRRRALLDLDLLRFWKWAARDESVAPSPHDIVVVSETERRLEAALAALPVAQREILLLVAVEGFSPSQAAEILHLRPEAARQRLRRARAAIGAALDDAASLRANVPEGETS